MAEWSKTLLIGFVLAGLVFLSDARAKNYTFSISIDPAELSSGNGVLLTGVPTFSLSDGDVISGNVGFTNGEFLNVESTKSNISYVDFQFSSSGNPNAYFTDTINLQRYSGTGISSSTPGNANGTVSAEILEPKGATYSFSGFSYSINISSIPANTDTSPYDIELALFPGTMANVSAKPEFVPEPSTLLMILTGLPLFYVCSRGKRQRLSLV